MQPFTLPLILVALGGAGLVVLRESRAVLAALLALWLGLAWAVIEQTPLPARNLLGLGRDGATELLTAAVCLVIAWTTLRGLSRAPYREPQPRSSGPRPFSDYLLPVAAALLAGIAGLGAANLFPLGMGAEADLIFYWAALSGTLTLVLDGSHDAVKVAAGLLVVLSATAMLVYALNPTEPGVALLGLMSAVRVAIAAAMAYTWVLLVAVYRELSLSQLFGTRDRDQETAIVAVDAPASMPTADVELLAPVREEEEAAHAVGEDANEEPQPAVEPDSGERSNGRAARGRRSRKRKGAADKQTPEEPSRV
jgi:hypothetical protein